MKYTILYIVMLTIYNGFLQSSETSFLGKSLIGKQIVSKQNINFSGTFLKKYSNAKKDFDLGKTLLAGNVVIVNFFQNDCINCKKEIPFLDYLATKYKDQKLKIICIDASENEIGREKKTTKYMEKMKLKSLKWYFDFSGNISRTYFVRNSIKDGIIVTVPAVYVIGKDYKFKYAKSGWVSKSKEKEYKKEFEKRIKELLK